MINLLDDESQRHFAGGQIIDRNLNLNTTIKFKGYADCLVL